MGFHLNVSNKVNKKKSQNGKELMVRPQIHNKKSSNSYWDNPKLADVKR
jgi:hypothetical protein